MGRAGSDRKAGSLRRLEECVSVSYGSISSSLHEVGEGKVQVTVSDWKFSAIIDTDVKNVPRTNPAITPTKLANWKRHLSRKKTVTMRMTNTTLFRKCSLQAFGKLMYTEKNEEYT